MYGQLIVVLAVCAGLGQAASTNSSADFEDEDYCFTADDEQNQLRNFGAETAYQVVKGVDSSEEFFVPSKIVSNFRPQVFLKLYLSQTARPKRFGC
jgi:hypothetical protein